MIPTPISHLPVLPLESALMVETTPYAFHAFNPLSYEDNINVRDNLDELLDRRPPDGEFSGITQKWIQQDCERRGPGAHRNRRITAHPAVIHATHPTPWVDWDYDQDYAHRWFWQHIETGAFILAENAGSPPSSPEIYWEHAMFDTEGLDVYGSTQEVLDIFLQELIRINDVYRQEESPAIATITCPIQFLIDHDQYELRSYFRDSTDSPLGIFGTFTFGGEADNGEIHIIAPWESRMDALVPPR